MISALELADRRALVTGGTKGIGEAVVTTLKAAGAKVLTASRTCSDHAPESDFVAADSTTAEGCDHVAEEIRAQLGGVDILVHVVGGSSAP